MQNKGITLNCYWVEEVVSGGAAPCQLSHQDQNFSTIEGILKRLDQCTIVLAKLITRTQSSSYLVMRAIA